jgi:hypothetical protein
MIDIGFNDVRKCMQSPVVDLASSNQGIAYVQNNFPRVIKLLNAAAGPRSTSSDSFTRSHF